MKIPLDWFCIIVMISCNASPAAKDKQIRPQEPASLTFPFENLHYNWKNIKNSNGIFALDEGSYWDKRNTILLRVINAKKPAILFQFQKRRLCLWLTAVHPGEEIYANDSMQLALVVKPHRQRMHGVASYEGEIIVQYKNDMFKTSTYGTCDSSALIKCPE